MSSSYMKIYEYVTTQIDGVILYANIMALNATQIKN